MRSHMIRLAELATLALIVWAILLQAGCRTELFLEVGDCTFYVDGEICLDEETIRRCSGELELLIVG